jgi:ubiquinone/menaquinone biosynthesis C-methylase UbiE
MSDNFKVVAEAFSQTSEKYDAFAIDHSHLTRLRNKVYAHLKRFIHGEALILELNAGTGIDAVELARLGYQVHATDIAAGMLACTREKVERLELNDRVTIQEMSYTRLNEVAGGPYDVIFSNLGGLNCIPNLRPVIQQLPSVLKPGGLVTWVLMPPTCLWEMAELLRGHFHLAFRRYAKNGALTHLEGYYFQTYYFTPRQVIDWFGSGYELLDVEGLAVITPTAESKYFPRRHPGLYSALAWIDDRVSAKPPWYGWGDFFIISMRYAYGSS